MEDFQQAIEIFINILKQSDLKLISKDTGVPYDRMYKWTKGKGTPKINDYNLLTEYLNGRNSKNKVNEHQVPYTKTHQKPDTLIPKQDIIRPNGLTGTVSRNKRNDNALIPFYNADFMAGAADVYYEDGVIYPEYYMDVPEFAGCTAFRAYSDSMERLIRSGSILLGIKLEDWASHLEFGQIYGITTTDSRRYLKYIRRNQEDDSKFLLKSENPEYDDFTIPKQKIKNIWLIEGWLDKRT